MEMIYGLIGLAIGVAAGIALGFWLGRRRVENTSVASIQRENEQFREQVTDHFVETVRLINQMTDSYKDVFDHLSESAEKLVDPATLSERLPQVSQREVRLKHLGAKQPSAPAADSVSGPSTQKTSKPPVK